MIPIEDRLLNFAVEIIRLSQNMRKEYREYALANQVLRSGTSIGANYEEACGAITKADYIAKISISLKEARETRYWIKLFHQSEYIDNPTFEKLHKECTSIINILGKVMRTVQKG